MQVSNINSEIIVVGAGICGLRVAQLLQEKKRALTVIEKSRGVGGRMATRRTLNGKFDHGAQFYSFKKTIDPLHERWLKLGLTEYWFEKNGIACFASPTGMASLAKELAGQIRVQFEHKITRIESTANGYAVLGENKMDLAAGTVILTAPLPQSLDLLKNSEIKYPKELDEITYTKALVGLFESPDFTDQGQYFVNYFEFLNPAGMFSISNQKSKFPSNIPSWSITMSSEFSEKFYEESDEKILAQMLIEIRSISSTFNFTEFQLKRWRYNAPRKRYSEPFLKVQEGLYLAGDAFGGASILGALRSAEALASAIP